MPTGYTADVGEGKVTEFREFALKCARAFGATVTQRDDPMSDLPKHRDVGSYRVDELKRANLELSKVQAMTVAEVNDAAYADYTLKLGYHIGSEFKKNETRLRYESMLSKVRLWNPPTKEHVELKNFMIQQLEQSIDFDCSSFPEFAPKEKTGQVWRIDKIKELSESIGYHHKELIKETDRCKMANEWIDALFSSLNDPKITPKKRSKVKRLMA